MRGSPLLYLYFGFHLWLVLLFQHFVIASPTHFDDSERRDVWWMCVGVFEGGTEVLLTIVVKKNCYAELALFDVAERMNLASMVHHTGNSAAGSEQDGQTAKTDVTVVGAVAGVVAVAYEVAVEAAVGVGQVVAGLVVVGVVGAFAAVGVGIAAAVVDAAAAAWVCPPDYERAPLS